ERHRQDDESEERETTRGDPDRPVARVGQAHVERPPAAIDHGLVHGSTSVSEIARSPLRSVTRISTGSLVPSASSNERPSPPPGSLRCSTALRTSPRDGAMYARKPLGLSSCA